MDEGNVEGFCERKAREGGEATDQRKLVNGGDWFRVSYERGDGWVQVQYILFDSGGSVHSIIDGSVSRETEFGYHDVNPSRGLGNLPLGIAVVSRDGWKVRRLV